MGGITGAGRLRLPPARGPELAEYRRGIRLLAMLGLMIAASWALAAGLAWLAIANLT